MPSRPSGRLVLGGDARTFQQNVRTKSIELFRLDDPVSTFRLYWALETVPYVWPAECTVFPLQDKVPSACSAAANRSASLVVGHTLLSQLLLTLVPHYLLPMVWKTISLQLCRRLCSDVGQTAHRSWLSPVEDKVVESWLVWWRTRLLPDKQVWGCGTGGLWAQTQDVGNVDCRC